MYTHHLSKLLLCALVSNSLGCALFWVPGFEGSEGEPNDNALDAGSADADKFDVGLGDMGPSDKGSAKEHEAGSDLIEEADQRAEDLGDRPDISMQSEGPMRVLFIGNSFTEQGPIPRLVEMLAEGAGWPELITRDVSVSGQDLAFHRGHGATLEAIKEGNWDAVVLQDFSTRPSSAGDPEGFKQDVSWFAGRIREVDPEARVILYMTWAYEAGHEIYPDAFEDPAAMQDQLTMHYDEAAARATAEGELAGAEEAVEVSPVGEAWRHHLAQPAALKLHAEDGKHASRFGQWLTALTLYATLYERRTLDLPMPELSATQQDQLRRSVDATSGQDEIYGGPDAMPFDPNSEPGSFEVGERILIDLGGADLLVDQPGWNNLVVGASMLNGLRDAEGTSSDISLVMTGTQIASNAKGLPDNTVNYPAAASVDSLWVGALGGTHAQAIDKFISVTFQNLDPQGEYTLLIFSSRAGVDEPYGRLTRYRVGERTEDFDPTNNRSTFVRFEARSPDAQGELTLTAFVSPAGGSRYAYIGALELQRIK